VILRQDDKKLGKRGDVVEVSEGYARNFLLPKNLAAAATEANLKQAKQQKDAANALVKETGLDIGRRKIELKAPSKKTGGYKAAAKLHPEIAAEFAVCVREEE
jgi:large subunit ribosomal protein L9